MLHIYRYYNIHISYTVIIHLHLAYIQIHIRVLVDSYVMASASMPTIFRHHGLLQLGLSSPARRCTFRLEDAAFRRRSERRWTKTNSVGGYDVFNVLPKHGLLVFQGGFFCSLSWAQW